MPLILPLNNRGRDGGHLQSLIKEKVIMKNKPIQILEIIRMLKTERDSKNSYWYPDSPDNNDTWYPSDKDIFNNVIHFLNKNEISNAVNLISRQDTLIRDAFIDIVSSVCPEAVLREWGEVEKTLLKAS